MRILFLLALPALAFPAILPDTIGAWQRGDATSPAPLTDQKLWTEYGLQASEIAPYSANGQKYTIAAYRFSDATGAFSALEQIRPDDAKPVTLTGIGYANDSDELVAVGNYLFVFTGYKPQAIELNHVVGTAPRYQQSPLPTLPKYLPPGAEPNSERYITGPESLAKFVPSVSPSIAAFHFSPEAAFAKYKRPGGDVSFLLFSYPTMEMARDRIPHFQQIPGVVAKRSGPLVALTLNGANADDAERLLSQVRYQAEVTVPEHVPTMKDNPGNLFLNIIILCGILAGFCLVSGLVVGGLKVLFRRAGASGEGDNMISLHLSGRQ
jgi:hypothetical protein